LDILLYFPKNNTLLGIIYFDLKFSFKITFWNTEKHPDNSTIINQCVGEEQIALKIINNLV